MEHHVYFDKQVETSVGTKEWVRTYLEFPTEKEAHNWYRRYTWSSTIKNIKVYPAHFSNKI